MKKIFILLAATATIATSCKKSETFNEEVKGPLSVEFDNIAGSSDLELNTTAYTNTSAESFKITKLKYYVSNFVFTKTDGSAYTVPQDESYFLIDENSGTEQEAEFEVPEGEYKTLSFTLGVDSLRSTADISKRTGVLDPAGAASGMYWNTNSGYIFFNMEGTLASAPGGSFAYHIGGYGNTAAPVINNIKTITLDLSARGTPKVKSGKETNIHLMVDVLKFFDGSSTLSITAHPSVMFESFSTTVAGNFSGMFKHDHTEN